jgi:hypothetical protein
MSTKVQSAVVDGKFLKDYYVDGTGNIWSNKYNKWRKLKPTKAGNTPYPRVSFYINGKIKACMIHRVVCETFHEFPIPEGVTEKEWSRTPASVKKLLRASFQVNHIDHQHDNYHPDNLEWVSVRQNSAKYQEYRSN